MQRFNHVDTWVFDLDNTLYEAESHVFVEMLKKSTAFIAQHFGISLEEANALRKDYFTKYGASWRGLMLEHDVPPHDIIQHMHDIDISPVIPCVITQDYVHRLPGRKIIFTNAPRHFADRMIRHLGLETHFDDIFTLEDAGYCPKPHIEAFKAFFEKYAIDPARTCMFEDSAPNLETAHSLGMTTVWIHGESEPGDLPFVHHKTDRLHNWLVSTLGKKDKDKDNVD